MYSLVIKNATIIDGTGSVPFRGDIAIEQDKIIAIAAKITTNAENTIDAHGLVVSPGFIDIQNHSDSYWQIFDNPSFDSLRAQGFTTILVGHCGASLAPLISSEALNAFQKWHSLEGTNINWSSFSELASHLSTKRFGCNVASLVGYSTLRRGLVGSSNESLDVQETKTLEHLYEQSLSAGAFGLSSGLSYGHELSVSPLELRDFINITAKANGLFSVHLRNEGEGILESIDSLIELIGESGVRTKISHLKIQGKNNWQFHHDLLDKLETARHRGIKIQFDVYPYDTVWQNVSQYLPAWAKLGGRQQILAHLKDSVQRKKIIDHIHTAHNNVGSIFVVSTANKLNVIGKKISQIAKDFETSSEEALLLLIEHGGEEILVFDQSLSSDNVNSLIAHPLSLIATDGGGFPNQSQVSGGMINDRLVHPRCFGTSAKFLQIVRDTNSISLSEAIHKLTLAPSQAIGLVKRGSIAVGNYADLVIFNPSGVSDQATITNPYREPKGIEYVIINGMITGQHGILLNNLSGQFLRNGI